MKKTLKKGIGTAMVGIGLFFAIYTAAGSNHEIGLRLAEAYDFQTEKGGAE